MTATAVADLASPRSATMDTAEALRKLAAVRDPAAWEALLDQNGADILRITRRILGDPMLAEDACQETLLQIRAHAGAFRTPASSEEAPFAARAWVMKIASRTALNMLRTRTRAKRREDAVACSVNPHVAASPAARQLKDEEAGLLRSEVASLPDDMREPLVMRFYGELDYGELAMALSCSPDAAKKRVQRGINRLRTRLALLGLALTLGDLVGNLAGKGIHAAEVAAQASASGAGISSAVTLDATHQAAWQALLNSPGAPAMASIVPAAGLAVGAKLALAAAGLLLVATSAIVARRAPATTPQQQALALPAASRNDDKPLAGDQAPQPAEKKAAPAEDPKAAAVRALLQKKVTFEFADTPMQDAVAFLSQTAGVRMSFDPHVAQDAKPAITLRVADMTVDLALQWTLKLAGFDYTIADGGVVIGKPQPRADAQPTAGAPAGDSDPWVQETRKKLAKHVSFEFVDTPLDEALQFLNSLAKVNIILDPKIVAKGMHTTSVSLRVQDMEMDAALRWILRLANLTYELRDNAIFVTEAAAGAAAVPAVKPPTAPDQF